MATPLVIPAQAGIQAASVVSWTPACAGVTESASYAAICNRQDVFTHTSKLALFRIIGCSASRELGRIIDSPSVPVIARSAAPGQSRPCKLALFCTIGPRLAANGTRKLALFLRSALILSPKPAKIGFVSHDPTLRRVAAASATLPMAEGLAHVAHTGRGANWLCFSAQPPFQPKNAKNWLCLA